MTFSYVHFEVENRSKTWLPSSPPPVTTTRSPTAESGRTIQKYCAIIVSDDDAAYTTLTKGGGDGDVTCERRTTTRSPTTQNRDLEITVTYRQGGGIEILTGLVAWIVDFFSEEQCHKQRSDDLRGDGDEEQRRGTKPLRLGASLGLPTSSSKMHSSIQDQEAATIVKQTS